MAHPDIIVSVSGMGNYENLENEASELPRHEQKKAWELPGHGHAKADLLGAQEGGCPSLSHRTLKDLVYDCKIDEPSTSKSIVEAAHFRELAEEPNP